MEGLAELATKTSLDIAVICAAFWFIKYMFDKFMTHDKEQVEKHSQEVSQLRESFENQKDVIANNTVVMQQILEVLRKDGINSEV